MRYNNNPHFQYTEREMTWKMWALAPWLMLNKLRYGRYLDVLIAHAPPYGIQDRSDLPHTGFKPFLPVMRWFRPRYLLHGHVHDFNPSAVTQTRYYETFVVNVYPSIVLDIPLISRKTERERR